MKIADINLQKAIAQAEDFKDRHHIPPLLGDQERQAYWSDVHRKLLALKSKKEMNKQ